ncbi:trafficking kinesin-binding protein 1-like [Hirundo rustica]|uniref:trafficking kinesin-binding protein 1-like n=1 Tax=Hirundo rustica TaxID=43150 RepID=UPI001A93ABB9|nr:trafficking kinesin-binding protein 1-like [Hirundo rustica]
MLRGSTDAADGRNPSPPPGLRWRSSTPGCPGEGAGCPTRQRFPSLSRDRRSAGEPELRLPGMTLYGREYPFGQFGHQKQVFETVRNVNQVVKERPMTPSPMNIPGSNQSSAMNSVISSCVSTPRSSFYGGDISNIMIDNKTNSIILQTESLDNGSALRRENLLLERKFFEEEQERKLRELAEKGELHSGSVTPTGSIMSLGTHSRFSEFTGYSGMSISSRSYLPEKLQIVKPLEGSATLHHWQQLVQPHLGGILDPRPGVVTKGFRTLDLDLDEVYCLNDYEEDETGDISYKGLTTSTPVQHTETSGERSQAQVMVSENKNNPRQSQAFTEEMQESATDDDEGSGEGNSLSPVKLTSLQDFDYWAILTSLQNSIHNIALFVASAR